MKFIVICIQNNHSFIYFFFKEKQLYITAHIKIDKFYIQVYSCQ